MLEDDAQGDVGRVAVHLKARDEVLDGGHGALGDPAEVVTDAIGDGWLGRYFDNQCAGAPGACAGEQGIAIGRSAPRR